MRFFLWCRAACKHDGATDDGRGIATAAGGRSALHSVAGSTPLDSEANAGAESRSAVRAEARGNSPPQRASLSSLSPPAPAARGASAAGLNLGLSPFLHAHHYDKLCAGIIFYSGGEVLLIQRNSRYNDLCWDLPGGQIDPADITVDEQYRAGRPTVPMYPGGGRFAPPALPQEQVPLYDQGAPTLSHGYGIGSGTWFVDSHRPLPDLFFVYLLPHAPSPPPLPAGAPRSARPKRSSACSRRHCS
jgi:hypothetical protein